MKKVISIALFGDGDKYAQYLPAFVRAHLNLFPVEDGWRLRVHIDDTVFGNEHGRYLARLFGAGLVDVARMGSAALTKAMLWRMAPVFDDGVDFVFCRDLDAPPMPRDRACCVEFIRAADKTRCAVHTVHDNLMHEGIMGGLCGFHAPALRAVTGWRSLDDLYAAAQTTDVEWARHGVDQLVLNRLLLRFGGPRMFEHRFAGWHGGAGKHPARGIGKYACGGVSAPVPNAGTNHPGVHNVSNISHAAEMIAQSDLLGNHLGCAGYDHVAARKFWDAHGDAGVAAKVAACEAP